MKERGFEFNLETDTSNYDSSELIAKLSARGRFVRQTGCPGDVGIIEIEVSNFQGESDFQLIWSVDEDTIPLEFSKGVIEGIKIWAEQNRRKKLKIEIAGGAFHLVDSRQYSFRKAIQIALDNAFGNTEK